MCYGAGIKVDFQKKTPPILYHCQTRSDWMQLGRKKKCALKRTDLGGDLGRSAHGSAVDQVHDCYRGVEHADGTGLCTLLRVLSFEPLS